MRSIRTCLGVALFCLAFTPVLHAQFGGAHGAPPSLQGIFHPVVGQGAAYDIQQADGKKSSIEITVVGTDPAGGYWTEMSFTGPMGEMIMKSLSTVQTDNVVVSRMIMQLPGKPPMEFPDSYLKRGSQPKPTDIKSQAEDLGSETITVPAGTFKCEHYRAKDGSGEYWVTQEVSPWGLVKSQQKDSTIVLTKTITDAKDKITGTPVPFNPMMLGGPPQQ